MSKLFQIGMSTAAELGDVFGHIASTVGGVNYECRGGAGCLRGSAARGAASPLFRHHYHRVLSEAEAARVKTYADGCVGEPYVLGQVPSHTRGGDCTGLQSGMVSEAHGVSPHRLFATSTWMTRFDDPDVGFQKGLGQPLKELPPSDPNVIGMMDRPYPGMPFNKTSPKTGPMSNHVRWIQARLNIAGKNHHSALNGKALDVDGDFGDDTFKIVVVFQQHRGLQGIGQVGPKTWALLNAVR
jgi:hypothetical protein